MKTNYRRDSFVDYPEKSKLLRNALSIHIFLSNVLLINCILSVQEVNKTSLMFLLIMMVIFLINKVKH